MKTLIQRIEALESGDSTGGDVLTQLKLDVQSLIEDRDTKTEALAGLTDRLTAAEGAIADAAAAITAHVATDHSPRADAPEDEDAGKTPAKKKPTK